MKFIKNAVLTLCFGIIGLVTGCKQKETIYVGKKFIVPYVKDDQILIWRPENNGVTISKIYVQSGICAEGKRSLDKDWADWDEIDPSFDGSAKCTILDQKKSYGDGHNHRAFTYWIKRNLGNGPVEGDPAAVSVIDGPYNTHVGNCGSCNGQ